MHWNDGMLEFWNIGKKFFYLIVSPFIPIIPLLHYSNIPDRGACLNGFLREVNTDGGNVGDYASEVGRGVHSHR